MKTNISFMQRMLLIVAGLVCASHVSAYDFKAENEDGVIIYYQTIDETDVEVRKPFSGGDYSGIVKIPSSVSYNGKTYTVTRIGRSAFKDCIDLESVILPESIKSIENQAFQGCISLLGISLPSSIREISDFAFSECNHLKNIDLPSKLKTIGLQAFGECYSLKSVSIPRSVTHIGDFAFYDCNLKTITSYIESPFILGDNAFDSSSKSSATLYVPFGTKEAYQETEGWEFKNIVEMEPTEEGASITMKNAMQSFCSSQSLDFSSAGTPEAYIASGFSSSTGEVIMSHVDIVPANTGVILKGSAGQTYKVPFTETDFFYSNLLEGVTETTTISSGYVLDGDVFVSFTGDKTVNAGEAYLKIPVSDGNKQLKIKFTETITGIEDLKVETADNAGWYSLQGTRLASKPTQGGIYIHQGKNVLVK